MLDNFKDTSEVRTHLWNKAPRSSRRRTTFEWPPCAAKCNAVKPFTSAKLTIVGPIGESSNFTHVWNLPYLLKFKTANSTIQQTQRFKKLRLLMLSNDDSKLVLSFFRITLSLFSYFLQWLRFLRFFIFTFCFLFLTMILNHCAFLLNWMRQKFTIEGWYRCRVKPRKRTNEISKNKQKYPCFQIILTILIRVSRNFRKFLLFRLLNDLLSDFKEFKNFKNDYEITQVVIFYLLYFVWILLFECYIFSDL